MDGMRLLRKIRERDLDLPVILITGVPTLDSAIEAVEHGALRCLTKPVSPADLRRNVAFALSIGGMAKVKRSAFELIAGVPGLGSDPLGVEAQFDRAVEKLWIAYQPIVTWSGRRAIGYEALLRTEGEGLRDPLLLLEAARKLGRSLELGRTVRARIARDARRLPADARLFVNLQLTDLEDPDLFHRSAPLSRVADRVALEITEREPIETVDNLRGRIAKLRGLGYRLAMDDLGAGHNGLATFIKLDPDIVKLDIFLARDVENEPRKQNLIRSMGGICAELEVEFITEGVETPSQREALAHLGCDLQQGYLFGRSERRFEPPRFTETLS